jgi:hypothetical protein
MDIAGYDSWRLAGPDYGHEVDYDDSDLRKAAAELAEDLMEDDYDTVEEVLLEDETWQGVAFDCAMGNIDQATLKAAILDILIQYLLEDRTDVVIDHATTLMRDRADEY